MPQPFEASRSLTALEQDSTVIAAIEMAQSKWVVGALVPGVKRQPLKKLDADEESALYSVDPLRIGTMMQSYASAAAPGRRVHSTSAHHCTRVLALCTWIYDEC